MEGSISPAKGMVPNGPRSPGIVDSSGENREVGIPPAVAVDGQNHAIPRLVIREMVLENFKSYAGAQRVGPFHKVGRLWLVVPSGRPCHLQLDRPASVCVYCG